MQGHHNHPTHHGFNSHAPEGARCSMVRPTSRVPCFNSHAPEGARLHSRLGFPYLAVSIHPPPRGRDTALKPTPTRARFQFTRPRGGAINQSRIIPTITSFNSHAPEGARFCVSHEGQGQRVSIHTPPRGRDIRSMCISWNARFQFTRPRGGAITERTQANRRTSFNSHAPEGARFPD